MSKSVLVVDTPKTCSDCVFCFEFGIGLACCLMASGEESDSWIDIDCDHYKNKPNWCPLKELPEEEHNDYYLDEYCDGYDDGWNTLRGKILGENKDV